MSQTTNYVREKLIGEKKIPYIDVLVKKNHETVYRYADGYGYKPTGGELLYTYSCTKPITAACAMRLLQDGVISLEDDVEKFLPECSNAFVLDEHGNARQPKNKIKIKHLLTMSAGFTYDRDTAPIKDILAATDGNATTREMISAFVKTPLAFEPGTDFLYGLCLDVLGAVIEVAAKMPFSEYVKKNVFAPLGMRDCTFDEKSCEDRILPCYVFKNGVYRQENIFNTMKLSSRYESGGAGLIASVEDYAKFADALACGGCSEGGYSVLGKDYVDLMRGEQISQISLNNTFTCVQGDDYGYGFGVRTRKKPLPCGVPIGEFGWDGAAGMYVLMDCKNSISVTIGLNVLDWPSVFYGEHLEIVKRIYGEILG